MNDILPGESSAWQYLEDTLRDVAHAYGYQEIGLPQLESTNLFKRLVGEATDIVEKEMYTFDDRNGDSLTLRPEGTAGCVRFAQENGLLFNQTQRFWYSGAMFRYERPQKGRYRQFEQVGAECFGMPGPDIDAELLLINWRIFKALGISGDVTLELNTLGDAGSRASYRTALVDYLSRYKQDLDGDSLRRLESNPLRILDSKVARTQEILSEAPLLNDYLDDESKQHLDGLTSILAGHDMTYVINPRIVRGLDYYNRTVFEWVTDVLGAQGTVCAGGRYDGLVEQLGGKDTPSVGFAMGLDRVALMVEDMLSGGNQAQAYADVYIVSVGQAARSKALLVGEMLREQLGTTKVVVHCGEGKFKGQLKKADASGARLAIILGEDEVASGTVQVKALRDRVDQAELPLAQLSNYCKEYLEKEI